MYQNITRSPFKTVINSILSAKLGYVIGYQITDLVGVAQNLMEHHPEYIKHFLLTLKVTSKKIIYLKMIWLNMKDGLKDIQNIYDSLIV